MKKLYRLVEAAGFSFDAFGVRVGIRVNAPWFIGRLQPYLPPGWHFHSAVTVDRLYSFLVSDGRPRPGVQRLQFVYCDSQPLARTPDRERLLEMFESDLNNFIAQTARTVFFIHAGVVGWNGRAILVPGLSGSGKTTLVEEFLRHGASYYSDEFAVLDERGQVWPFPKPLAVREEATRQQTRVAPEELGSTIGTEALPVGFLLLTRYRKFACWKPQVMSSGRGVLGLLANAFSARQQPKRALAILERAVHKATVLSGVRGEAKDVVRQLFNR